MHCNAEIVFNIRLYSHYNSHDPLGGYANFHIRKQTLLARRIGRTSRQINIFNNYTPFSITVKSAFIV